MMDSLPQGPYRPPYLAVLVRGKGGRDVQVSIEVASRGAEELTWTPLRPTAPDSAPRAAPSGEFIRYRVSCDPGDVLSGLLLRPGGPP